MIRPRGGTVANIVGAEGAFVLPAKSLARYRAVKDEERTRGGAFPDTSYWPVYRPRPRDYPLVRLANVPPKRGRLSAGRKHQSHPRYVSLMNITYDDFHGALSRLGTPPANVKAGKRTRTDYPGESIARLFFLFSIDALALVSGLDVTSPLPPTNVPAVKVTRVGAIEAAAISTRSQKKGSTKMISAIYG